MVRDIDVESPELSEAERPTSGELGLVCLAEPENSKKEMWDLDERRKTFQGHSQQYRELAKQGVYCEEVYTEFKFGFACVCCHRRVMADLGSPTNLTPADLHTEECWKMKLVAQRDLSKHETTFPPGLDQNSTLDGNLEKVICTRCCERLSAVLFLPCGHVPYCMACFDRVATELLSRLCNRGTASKPNKEPKETVPGATSADYFDKPENAKVKYFPKLRCLWCQGESRWFTCVAFSGETLKKSTHGSKCFLG